MLALPRRGGRLDRRGEAGPGAHRPGSVAQAAWGSSDSDLTSPPRWRTWMPAVIWENHSGIVFAVGGLLDNQDILSVARQIG